MCAWRRRMRGEARGEELAAHAAMRWRHEVAAWQCEVTAWRHGTAPTATLSATFSLLGSLKLQLAPPGTPAVVFQKVRCKLAMPDKNC
ncbi:hypothetical protein SETIT_8G101800v2 [Setaria italica]|uniref:Uncharacterized protein n=1 Tax=Setaria italica TaxID=4555 RepID=K3ZKL6_SETIT|nr:hypothetical protein SETIT_8G101800v2 [Setaria italica]RCV37918.1 hypothetical protein SETIT_8G101800v2 [Setaria italica]